VSNLIKGSLKRLSFFSALLISFSLLLLSASCTGNTDNNYIGQFRYAIPPEERWSISKTKLPKDKSGVSGIDIVSKKTYITKSAESAIILSALRISYKTDNTNEKSPIDIYTALLADSLGKKGKCTVSQDRNEADESSVYTFITDMGSIISVKVIFCKTGMADALSVDCFFLKKDYSRLQNDMINLLDSIQALNW
jgi:hypothetical protein